MWVRFPVEASAEGKNPTRAIYEVNREVKKQFVKYVDEKTRLETAAYLRRSRSFQTTGSTCSQGPKAKLGHPMLDWKLDHTKHNYRNQANGFEPNKIGWKAFFGFSWKNFEKFVAARSSQICWKSILLLQTSFLLIINYCLPLFGNIQSLFLLSHSLALSHFLYFFLLMSYLSLFTLFH